MASPSLPGHDDSLESVAALSATDAWAVGTTLWPGSTQSLLQPLIEHWNGQTWRRVAIPDAARGYFLLAVAGSSPTNVWAVGMVPGGTGTLILHWDGRRWRVVPGAALGQYGGSLTAVTALASDDAWASGRALGRALIEHWDGQRWQVSAGPTLPGDVSHLDGVTALSRTDVWAVGGSSTDPYPDAETALILHWDGHSWSVVPGPDSQESLFSVAALSARDVWASGGSTLEHWDGRRWSAVPVAAGSSGALVATGPHELWSLGAQFQRYTGHLCSATRVAVRTIALPGVGVQPTGMFPTRDAPGALLVASAPGRAVVRDQSGAVWVLDTTRGRVVRQTPLDASGPLTVDGPGGRVFVPSTRGGGSVQVLDATTGRVTGAFPASASPAAVAFDVPSGHLVVAGAYDVRVLDTASGRTVAIVPLTYATALALDSVHGRVVVLSYGGQSGLGTLSVLDTRSGAVVTTLKESGWPLAIAAGAGRVYVATADSTTTMRVSVWDLATGVEARTVTLGRISSGDVSALLADPTSGQVFIASSFGLQILDAMTGALRTLETRSPTVMAFDPRRGRLYTAYINNTNQYGSPVSPGSVAIFDAPTGARVAMVTVDSGPDAIAVDAASGKALVLVQRGVDMLDALPGSPPAR